MIHDRMFHVIVLGGIGLVACGGVATGSGDPGDASSETATDAFPSEGKTPGPDAFPSETATVLDASTDGFPSETDPAGDATIDSFPTEGPAMLDASGDVGPQPDGFPSETAVPFDSGAVD
jgi:hypothetical protein